MNLVEKYRKDCKPYLVAIAIVGLLFLTIQTYLAQPRSFWLVANDLILPILVVSVFTFILYSPKNIHLFTLGIIFYLITLLVWLTSSIPKPYGTFFFLFGSWLLVDWFNGKRFGKSVIIEISSGNYRLTNGVILSTLVFGLITEVVNLPFMIWEYNIPLPSIDTFGVPALLAAFGWTPWILSILAIFYPFTQPD